MEKHRHDILLERLEPALYSETFKNLDFSSQEHIDLAIMGFIFHKMHRQAYLLLESDKPITRADIERTDPNDEEAAELERIADWIVKKCQEANGER